MLCCEQQVLYTGKEKDEIFNGFNLIPVSDLTDEESRDAARNSLLMDPEVFTKLLTIASDSEEKGVGKMSPVTARSLAASVCRGVYRMMQSLGHDYFSWL